MNYQFTVFAFIGKIDLNRTSARLAITRKYRWEEPMILNPVTFSLAAGDDGEQVCLYYFGGLVFLNCSGEIIARFHDGIVRFAEHLNMTDVFSSLSHARRSARLERIIIILIAIEIVLYVMGIIRSYK